MRLARRRRDDEGAAAVEFALLLPVMLLILFGIIEIGILVAQALALSNATRLGARYAVVEGAAAPTCADVTSAVRKAAKAPRMDSSTIQVTVLRGPAGSDVDTATGACGGSGQPCQGAAFDDQVFVRSTYAGRVGIPAPGFVLDEEMTLTSVGVFRCEYR